MYETSFDINTFIEQKMYLVKKVVQQVSYSETIMMSYDDFISVGLIGLYDAITKYDKSKNSNFDAYAKVRIRGAIIDELRKTGEISRNKMGEIKQFILATNHLTHELGREPNENEIIDYLNITEDDLNEIYRLMHFLSKDSLDRELFDDVNVISTIESDSFDSPEDALDKKELNKLVATKIKLLEHRLQLILNFIYVEELSLKEISDILDISVSRISQLHGKALIKLRTMLKE